MRTSRTKAMRTIRIEESPVFGEGSLEGKEWTATDRFARQFNLTIHLEASRVRRRSPFRLADGRERNEHQQVSNFTDCDP
jgi:hypothetical protein